MVLSTEKLRNFLVICALCVTIVRSTSSLLDEECTRNQEYCPSSCVVMREIFSFQRDAENTINQEKNQLDFGKVSLDDIRWSNQFNDMPTLSDQVSLKRLAGELKVNAKQLQENFLNLAENIKQQEIEVEELTNELAAMMDTCLGECTTQQEYVDETNMEHYAAPRYPCGVDTLCGRAAYGATSSVLHQSEYGTLCPEFNTPEARSCAELYQMNYRRNGIYNIKPDRTMPIFRVYCDMEDSGGGWIVIQRRIDGSVEFNRTWVEYNDGFGDISCTGEFWLGNEKLASIDPSGFQTARFVMTDWAEETRVAQYSYFRVNRATLGYTLQISAFQRRESNTSDSMTARYSQNNVRFSTYDHSNLDPRQGGNCARSYGGWWLNSCNTANLNGYYHQGGKYNSRLETGGIIWWSWKGFDYSLRKTEIKIRPHGFTGG